MLSTSPILLAGPTCGTETSNAVPLNWSVVLLISFDSQDGVPRKLARAGGTVAETAPKANVSGLRTGTVALPTVKPMLSTSPILQAGPTCGTETSNAVPLNWSVVLLISSDSQDGVHRKLVRAGGTAAETAPKANVSGLRTG